MIHDVDEYPDYTTLPSQRERIYERDWDVLTVLDACRWDALDEIVTGSERDATVEQLQSPALYSTPDWVCKIWDDTEWGDITYISANPFVREVRNLDGFPDFHIENVVGEFVDLTRDTDRHHHVVRPEKINREVKRHEPPIVAHYMQPHLPFVGKLTLTGSDDGLFYDIIPDSDSSDARGIPYRLASAGLIDKRVVRAAYIENAIYAWRYAKTLDRDFTDVVVTSDHGEALGPDSWDHGGPEDPRKRIVPWVEL